MKHVLGREELEQIPRGGTISVGPDTIVTPLARDYAEEMEIELVSTTPEEDAVVDAVLGEIARNMHPGRDPVLPTAAGLTPMGTPEAQTPTAHIAQCMACPNTSPNPSDGRRAIISCTGSNRPGIIAGLSAEIAKAGGDILDLSQTIVAGFFTMLLVVDTRSLDASDQSFADFRDRILAVANDLGCEAQIVHERVLQSMHRV